MHSPKRIATGIALFLALVMSRGAVYAQQPASLTGKWKMHSSTPEGNDVPWTLTISNDADSGQYSATAGTDAGEIKVKELHVDGTKIHFRVPYQGFEYDIDLTLEKDDKLSGTWSGNGNSGDTKGEKVVGT